MTGRPEYLSELVGADVPQEELALIAHADTALRATPAPPEASETLAARVLAIPGRRGGGDRRRLFAGLAIAAGFAAAAFGIGLWAGGDGGGGIDTVEKVTLVATRNAPPGAEMTLDVLPVDDAGNWKMSGDVTGLAPLPAGSYYEVWLTKGGELAEPCGRFVVDETGRAENVWLNAPYTFGEYDRWVVVAVGPDGTPSEWLLDGPVVVPA